MTPPRRLSTEDINNIIEAQLDTWETAKRNFFALGDARRRPLSLGALDAAVQNNPARIRSTGAAVDAASIAARPCFLCRGNRPPEQFTIEWMPGWELLVNPYPILPVHFTVASASHTPQSATPLDMAVMAEAAPDLVFFFNGARAGASAPDHLHVQAVLASELPLMRLAEKTHPSSRPGILLSDKLGLDLPFHFVSAVITPDATGMRALTRMAGAFGVDADTGGADRGLVNTYFWIGPDSLLRAVAVPRRRHRPACYDAAPDKRLIISPGAIDMAGLLVAPRAEDFERVDAASARAIYSDVAFADRLPDPVTQWFES